MPASSANALVSVAPKIRPLARSEPVRPGIRGVEETAPARLARHQVKGVHVALQVLDVYRSGNDDRGRGERAGLSRCHGKAEPPGDVEAPDVRSCRYRWQGARGSTRGSDSGAASPPLCARPHTPQALRRGRVRTAPAPSRTGQRGIGEWRLRSSRPAVRALPCAPIPLPAVRHRSEMVRLEQAASLVSMTARLGLPRGLFALCLSVALLITLPVAVTVVQAIEGGFGALSTALRAPATKTLLLHSLEVAVVATPIATAIGVAAAWFVERTRLPGRRLWAVLLVAPLTIPPFVTSYSWASLGTYAPGLLGRERADRVHLLPDRLPARRGRASRSRPGARGDRALARAERPEDLLPRDPAAAPPRTARRRAARRSGHADRVRRLRRASGSRRSPPTSTLSTSSASAPPVQPRSRSRRSPSASSFSSARRDCAATPTTRGSARARGGPRPATTSAGRPIPVLAGLGGVIASASASRSAR